MWKEFGSEYEDTLKKFSYRDIDIRIAGANMHYATANKESNESEFELSYSHEQLEAALRKKNGIK